MAELKSPAASANNGATSSTTPGHTPAQLAKAALRRLAEQKLEPTPDNYRKAYEAEAGGPGAMAAQTAAQGAAQGAAPKPQLSDAEDGQRWSGLITKLLRGAERGGRQWTTARKKDSLQRVLEGSKNSAERLHQRLSQLIGSWDSDRLDSAPLDDDGQPSSGVEAAPNGSQGEASSPAIAATGAGHTTATQTGASSSAGASAATDTTSAWPQLALHAMDQLGQTVSAALPSNQAPSEEAAHALKAAMDKGRDLTSPIEAHEGIRNDIAQACEQARRIIDHRHHLISQLTDLCLSLTDSLADLSEDDSWVQGQCVAMRHQLGEGLQSRGVRHVQLLLAETREKQYALKRERDAARQSLKQLIHQMLQEVAELGSTTDRFQSNLGRYADTIEEADSLESLAGVVREMVTESRAVQGAVAQAQTRLNDEHSRATQLGERVRQLEDEIRKLSDEVSTDPLTQIANRRGMMRAFEIEQTKMARDGTQLAIGLLDVDNFKKLNDTLGHQTGDEALKFLARRVGECLRPVDVVARYGGEEFVVLLPGTPVEEAQQVLTRLQRTLSAEFFTHEDKKVFITFSAGVTPYRTGEAIEAALDRADVALYEAKRTGKNRTCMG